VSFIPLYFTSEWYNIPTTLDLVKRIASCSRFFHLQTGGMYKLQLHDARYGF